MKLLTHSTYNFIGLSVPLIAALVAVPELIRQLGDSRFGMLTVIWGAVGYLGFADLGLGRALTHQLAVAYARDKTEDIRPLVGTSLALMAVLGGVAGVLLLCSSVFFSSQQVAPEELNNSLVALAVALPFIILTTGLRGILEAKHHFGTVNLLRVPLGALTFLAPLAVTTLGAPRLDYTTYSLAGVRIVGFLLHAYFAILALEEDTGRLSVRRSLVTPLLRTGGWLTISNIVSPFMGYVDRLLLATAASAAAVAYYATPQEIVTKLWIIPGAVTAVLFPTFASLVARKDASTAHLFSRAVYGLFWILLPITALLTFGAWPLLGYWIGAEFARESARLLQVFSVGLLINCLAHVPFTFLQGSDNAKQIAFIHLAELPVFLAALWILSSAYGAFGASLAWLGRMGVDSALMFFAASRVLGTPWHHVFTSGRLWVCLVAALLCFSAAFHFAPSN